MPLFAPQNRDRNTHSKKLYASFELAHTLVDVAAALFFLVGSFMFFSDALKNPAIWCFVIGSALFAVKPILRLIREFRLVAEGDVKDLAEREKG